MVYLPTFIIYHTNQPNVGIYIPYMDSMGMIFTNNMNEYPGSPGKTKQLVAGS